MKGRHKPHLFLCGLLLCASWACKVKSDDQQLMQEPERRSTIAHWQPGQSQIDAKISITYNELRAALVELTTQAQTGSGKGSWEHQTWIEAFGGKTKGPKVKLDYRYEYKVWRDGPISVSRYQDRVRIEVPISAKGNAGFRGAAAKLLKLDRKNFDGRLNAFFDLGFDLDQAWCPVVEISVSHTWRSRARVEILDGVYVDMSPVANDLLDDLVDDLSHKVKETMDCQEFRRQVSVYWKPYALPIHLPYEVGPFFLQATPKTMAFSGVLPTENRVSMVMSLRADTMIAPEQPEIPETLSLPELKRAGAEEGKVRLELPIGLRYETLEQAANHLLQNQDFELQLPAGGGNIRIDGVDIFPSGQLLSLALRFSADLPTGLLSTEGTAFLTDRPTVDLDQQILSLQELSYSQVIDNKMWNLVAKVFESQLRPLIANQLRVSFADQLERTEKEISRVAQEEGLTRKFHKVPPRSSRWRPWPIFCSTGWR